MAQVTEPDDGPSLEAMQAAGEEETATKPRQPHDVLVKKIFGNPKYARVELEAVLPAEVVAAIDWSTLEVLPETFIDPAFAKTQADLLFRVQLAGRDARIYFVFEHKSDAKARSAQSVRGTSKEAACARGPAVLVLDMLAPGSLGRAGA